jgi:hypothetical protein
MCVLACTHVMHAHPQMRRLGRQVSRTKNKRLNDLRCALGIGMTGESKRRGRMRPNGRPVHFRAILVCAGREDAEPRALARNNNEPARASIGHRLYIYTHTNTHKHTHRDASSSWDRKHVLRAHAALVEGWWGVGSQRQRQRRMGWGWEGDGRGRQGEQGMWSVPCRFVCHAVAQRGP